MADQQLYTVKGAVVKVSVGGAGHRIAQILRRGDVVPFGIEQERLDQLEKRDLIAKVETEPVPEPEGQDAGDGTPSTPTKPDGRAGYDKHAAWATHLGIEIPTDVAEKKDRDAVKALIEKHEADASKNGQ